MSDPDIAAYVERLLTGPLYQPGRRYVLVDGVMEPVDPVEYQPRPPVTRANLPAKAAAHRLYRWFDANDVLLYVGITSNLGGRAGSHLSRAFWMRYVARMESDPEGFTSRENCEAAEAKAIREELPIFNVAGQPDGHRQRQIDYVLFAGRPEHVEAYLRWLDVKPTRSRWKD